jgi:hypothetical protein
MARASELLAVAQSWLGKKESDGSHKAIIDIYNSHKPLARGYKVKYTDEWCATTISALAIKCNAVDIIPKECSCQKMIELFKKIGCWVENDAHVPNAGDIIFYDWQDNGVGDNKGWSDHVGIVEKVEGNIITVIEGNIKDAVGRRELKVDGKYIRGYGVPKYEPEIAVPTKSVEDWAKEVIAGDHGDGHAIREASLKKEGCPYPYQTVRTKVNELCKKPAPAPKPAPSPYYPKYTGASGRVDEVFKAIGVPSQYIGAWKKRIPVANANGVKNYTGTAKQNGTLVSLAKKGTLKKV